MKNQIKIGTYFSAKGIIYRVCGQKQNGIFWSCLSLDKNAPHVFETFSEDEISKGISEELTIMKNQEWANQTILDFNRQCEEKNQLIMQEKLIH